MRLLEYLLMQESAVGAQQKRNLSGALMTSMLMLQVRQLVVVLPALYQQLMVCLRLESQAEDQMMASCRWLRLPSWIRA